MSYDVDIGGECFNYTSNVAALFYDHIPASKGGRGGLHELHGKAGCQAAPILADAFKAIGRTRVQMYQEGVVGDPAFCAKYDAQNGWGSAIGALLFLAAIMAACHRHPLAIVEVDA